MKIKPEVTKDYGMFSFIKGNRPIDNAHVNRLIVSFKEKTIFDPIKVNEKMEIIDGQHRFLAMKALGIEVPYFVIPGLSLPDVHRLNNNKKNWSNDDHANSYVVLGKKDYTTYLEFRKKYGFQHRDSVSMLAGGKNRNLTYEFQNGLFEVKDLMGANKIASQITEIGQHYKRYKRSAFVGALLKLFTTDRFDYPTLLYKVGEQTERMKNQVTVEENYNMLVKIYNFSLSTKRKLALMAQ